MGYITGSSSPAAAGPRLKGHPFKVQPFIFFVAPMEDLELNE
jgi:hypothetical protein